MTFSELKALINQVDETQWGPVNVLVNDLPVTDLAYVSGLPACDNRFHGKQSAVPPRIELITGTRHVR